MMIISCLIPEKIPVIPEELPAIPEKLLMIPGQLPTASWDSMRTMSLRKSMTRPSPE